MLAVRPEEVAVIYPQIEDWVELMARRSRGRYLAKDFVSAIQTQEWQLWVVVEGGAVIAAIVTQLIKYPRRIAVHYRAIVGRDYKRWRHLEETISTWAKKNGATLMESFAPPGWSRMTDRKIAHVLIEKDI